ncbi:MAG: hypothetical protein VXU52_04050 [Bacteroidota bacterium]|jgi:hypothetical protein|nr:hypothetical protein [Bacteroidota bacterium]
MDLLSSKNHYERDERIQFSDSDHTYLIDKKNKAVSVTELIGRYFPKFDKEFWANKESIKTGKPKNEILKKWDELGKKARDLGTELHEQIENFYNSKEYIRSKELDKFFKFHKNHIQDKYQPHRTEWRIFDEDKNLAGTVDMVYEKENGELFIFDWKRSKKIINSDGSIEKNNPFENGLNGLSHLPSSDYVKYCLQQNIYKNILESKYDKKVSSMNLLILHPHLDNYHIIQVESFKNETKYLLDSI